MKNKGLSIHCHHNTLVEYCYDYKERVHAIKTTKPTNEIPTRLKLFKLLPEEAIAELPERLKKTYAELEKAGAEWKKTYAELEKADAEWKKTYAEWKKAYAEWKPQAQKVWHDKWCGCKEWNGEEIVFPERR